MRAYKWLIMTLSSCLMLSYSMLSTAEEAQTMTIKPYVASYKVQSKGLTIGKSDVRLHYQDNQYFYEKSTTATGLAAMFSGDKMIEKSQGKITNQQFIPSYHLKSHENKRKNQQDTFNRGDNHLLSGQLNNDAYQLQAKANTIDSSIIPLQLMLDNLTQQAQYQYNVAEKGKLKTYTLKKVGTEKIQLSTNSESYLCDKFEVVRENKNEKTTIWLAQTLNSLPIRIQHNDDGDIIDSELQTYQTQ